MAGAGGKMMVRHRPSCSFLPDVLPDENLFAFRPVGRLRKVMTIQYGVDHFSGILL